MKNKFLLFLLKLFLLPILAIVSVLYMVYRIVLWVCEKAGGIGGIILLLMAGYYLIEKNFRFAVFSGVLLVAMKTAVYILGFLFIYFENIYWKFENFIF